MIDRKKVLSIIKEKGPVIPRDVVKQLGGDTFLVGAVLSELADKKEIRLSHTKLGGSPVYYISGQEERLQNLYEYLKEKEKKAFDLLKEKKILEDQKAEPPLRVALRNIRDFAKPLEVNANGQRKIFWKWFLLPPGEAESMIRNRIGIKKKSVPANPTPKPKDPESKEHLLPEEQEKKQEKPKEEEQKKLEKKEAEDEDDHELLQKARKYLGEKGIEILETEIIRKNSDIEMIVRVPSGIGGLTYFCKVRDKKKSNDKDLSSAYVQSQVKKLPVIYLTTGKLTNKAKEKLEKEFSIIKVVQF